MLESAVPYVQEIVAGFNGTNPETEAILSEFNARIIRFQWQENFGWARNLVMAECKNDHVLWLDCDDILIGGDHLAAHARAFSIDPSIGSLWLYYNYDQDKSGNCIASLWRERLLNRHWFRWKGMLHEEALRTRSCKHAKVPLEDMYVLHQTSPERIRQSAIRNLNISKAAYEKGQDPAAVWYYARSLVGIGQTQESIPIFEQFAQLTDSDEHRYDAYLTLSGLYRNFMQIRIARDYALQALDLRPLWPMAYFSMAENHTWLKNWPEVIHWTRLGFGLKHPGEDLPMVWNPRDYYYKPLEPFCMALIQTAKFEEARLVAEKGLSIDPGSAYFNYIAKHIPKLIEQQKLEASCLNLYNHLSKNGESHKLEAFSRSLPDLVADYPTFKRLSNRFQTDSPQSGKKLVFYCGTSYEDWDDTSMQDGIGGSEEAVIHMARQLAKLGWEVEVYNQCRQAGERQGVRWCPIWEYDPAMTADVFIAWRDSRSIALAPENSYCVLWLHDVQKMEYYNQEMLDRVDRIFVLSQWHRYNLPEIEDRLFYVTRNGIDSGQFSEPSSIERDPLRCVYASSPDRGLDRLLAFWPDILKAVPEAELHIYYGFTATYDNVHTDNHRMLAFKESILKAVDELSNVYWHGRIGHIELAEQFKQAGLWLYPTQFTEISCITAMKAQAAGMIPVTMTLAALNETVQHGFKFAFGIQDERTQLAFKQRTINLLKHPDQQEKIRPAMMEWARDYFKWETVAKEWDEHFRETYLRNRPDRGCQAVSGLGAESAEQSGSGRPAMETGSGAERNPAPGLETLDQA